MYTDINDVKRVMQNAARIDFQYLVQYFGRLEALDAIDILRDMMRTSANRNLKLVVEVSRTWSEKFGALELIKVFEDMRENDIDMLTLGQYLMPSKNHYPMDRYVHPDEFDELGKIAEEMGFLSVASGPLVRSSYHADKQVDLSKLKAQKI
jgi:hypothetical protein